MHAALIALLLALSLAPGQLKANPTTPGSDTQVLERLPFKPGDPVAREMASLRTQLQRDPKNPALAAQLARKYYSLVAEEGDPRYLGYAQAALAPWWEMAQPPDEIQVLRASLRQFRHDFDGAISDLNAVLTRQPGNTQARALRATIHIVQARYPQGRSDCSALHSNGSTGNELIATACEAMADGLSGKSSQAFNQLQQALNQALQERAKPSAADQLWVRLRLAELAQRLGRNAEAEAQYQSAIRLGIMDTFLFAAWADFLLDQGRFQEVITLLKDKTRSDTLLLRLALAEHALRPRPGEANRITLTNRYAAAQLRGDTAHQQEEARFALRIENNAQKALKLAQENWKVQREPRDARIFLEAALALHDAAAAQPVLQWLRQSQHEDPALLNLAKQLGSGGK